MRRWTTSLGLLASVLVHLGLVTALTLASPSRALPRASAPLVPQAPVELELAPASETPAVAAPSTLRAAEARSQVTLPVLHDDPPPTGSDHRQNLNTRERGQGGDGRSREDGRLMAERAEALTLSPNLQNTLAAEQEHRIRTDDERTSPQQRRSTPNAGYDPWLASSEGILAYRVNFAVALPSDGVRASAGREVPMGRPEPPRVATSDDGVRAPLAVTPVGGVARPTAGVVSAREHSATRVAGPSAFGRPSIEQGHASTVSELEDTRPRDNADAEALATRMLTNALATTVQTGPRHGDGQGGVGGGGAPGSGGGEGQGGRAQAYAEGDGWLSLNSPDARYARYLQRVRRALDPLWADAFPHDEALAMRQGTVILRFVIEPSGSLREVHVQRASSIVRFDDNVVAAVRGARVPPLPAELHLPELRVSASFQFRNPMVR